MGGPPTSLGSLNESDDEAAPPESLPLPLPLADPLPDELPLVPSEDDDSSGSDSDTPLPPPPPPPASDELEGSPTLSLLEPGSLPESELLPESEPLEADPELLPADPLPDEEPPGVESLLELEGSSLPDQSLEEESLDDSLADELPEEDEETVLEDEPLPLAEAEDELLPGGL